MLCIIQKKLLATRKGYIYYITIIRAMPTSNLEIKLMVAVTQLLYTTA